MTVKKGHDILFGKNRLNINKDFITITEDIISGILLSVIVDCITANKSKSTVKKEGKIWMVSKRKDWFDRCRIKERQFDRAINILKQMNIVDVKIWKYYGEPQQHISLNIDVLKELLNDLNKNNQENSAS